jgi:hypothetical protein
MNNNSVGMPLDISDQNKLWGGSHRTNGFLHTNVDGRIPALQVSWAHIARAALENPISEKGAIPWGNALWKNLELIDTQPNTIYPDKPAKAQLAGVLKFEQGWQSGNPIIPYGLMDYTLGTLIPQGLVGYKVSMAEVGMEDEYYKFLQNQQDRTYDVPDVRKTYKDWMALLKAANDGSKLGLFFGNASGFPIMAVVPANELAHPALTDATFGGFARLYEPENQCVYASVDV